MNHVNATGKPTLSARAILLIELALAMGGFAIGTGEFAIMGLMPNVAQGLGISEPQVGHVISAYALGVVVGAPLLAILGSRVFRRHLLLLLMTFFALGNFASAMAADYHTLMVFRFIAGLPHGAYFGVAMLVAASMVAPDQRAKAVSRVLAGLTIAMLIGNPTATWLGQWLSWRWAFGLVGLIALLTVLLVAIFLPLDRSEPRNNPMLELRDFNRKPVWLALAISSIGFAGMFCVFSYLAPTLLEVTGVGEHWIPVGLAALGLGGIVGNIFGGWLFDKLGFKAIAWLLLWSIVVLLVFPLAAHSLWTILPAAFAVGTMISLGPPLQTHLMDVAGEAQTLAAASNHSAFNVANALGPWLGGLAISAGLGWTSTGYIGAATAAVGLLVFWWAWTASNPSEETRGAATACD
ncbi:MAG: MFS transporter [Gammaproteobacteria bacterium]|uniref:MFS transporter n=1 Tax=Stutzerimonas xanthomarina TaxID=271420 RepID=UPI000E94927E|nr:MFS transporter [Stutzerimonas xanthomarina]MBU0812514.1 MFS transporter [Gammaproteobacteria bacterium]HAW22408.1 MFS transporter [Pseudomonas sp.]MBK3846943.1 MFS transporter [Stutzerimonas xanthomarina]MBU0852213.1 MFS transporter [Gammaproteobacteria bacterium]MBU1302755.1 MFS transporter [Gammaproteobacteria bacterium]|tara:strand:+ start:153 stop:1376 length:1224 start_codon:yes stop_codon:yes gene_type:complete